MLDYSIINDGLASGRMSAFTGNFLRFAFIPAACCLALTYLFLTGNTDPGYVGIKSLCGNARAERRGISAEDEEEDEEEGLGDQTTHGEAKAPHARSQRQRDYFESLRHSYYDYCDRCKVNLPMDRSIGHCDVCDACIDGLDHHCPWVGGCIGAKNTKFFVRFNVCWGLLLGQLVLIVVFN